MSDLELRIEDLMDLVVELIDEIKSIKEKQTA